MKRGGQGTSGKLRPFSIVDRKASVIWNGTLREGTGTLSTESGVLADTQYSFRTRFPEGRGTNPDELIAASLGGCFSMALSNELGIAGFHPRRIETVATATVEDLAAGWTLTRIQLDVRANVPLVSQAHFMKAALAAKTKCPVARLLNTTISMSASLNP
jgi:osmotically inducible protein OsmC